MQVEEGHAEEGAEEQENEFGKLGFLVGAH